jgi:hypothetical protein
MAQVPPLTDDLPRQDLGTYQEDGITLAARLTVGGRLAQFDDRLRWPDLVV